MEKNQANERADKSKNDFDELKKEVCDSTKDDRVTQGVDDKLIGDDLYIMEAEKGAGDAGKRQKTEPDY